VIRIRWGFALAAIAAAMFAPTHDARTTVHPPLGMFGLATRSVPLTLSPPIKGATVAQRAILSDILSRLGPSRIESLGVALRDNRDWDGELRSLGIKKPPDYVPPNTVQLIVHFAFGDWETEWKARLLADAFRELSEQAHLPAVIWLDEKDGDSGIGGSALGPWGGEESGASEPVEHLRPLSPADEALLLKDVREAASASGARVERLELLRPYAHAFILVVRADDARAFLSSRLEPLMDSLQPWIDETAGEYVEVRDEVGTAWLTAGHESPYSSGGFGGPRPDLVCFDPFTPLSTPIGAPDPCQDAEN
jgi:hypothetical protein